MSEHALVSVPRKLRDDAAGVLLIVDALRIDEDVLDGGLLNGEGRRDGEERVHDESLRGGVR